MLTARGMDDIGPEFADTLQELLSRIDMRLVTADLGSNRTSVVAYVDIEAGETEAVVWITDPKRNLPRFRREVLRASSRDVFRETLAHVVLGAVETYVAEPVVEEAPPPQPAPQPAPLPLPQPAPLPPPQPAPRPPIALGVENEPKQSDEAALLYDLSARGGPLWFAERHVGAVFGAGFRMTLNRRLPPSWALEAGFMLPATIDAAGVRADLQIVNLRAIQRFAFLRTERVVLDLGIALGLDRMGFVPTSSDATIELEESSRRLQPMAGVTAGANFVMTPQLALVANIGSDVDAAPRRWVVDKASGRDTILEPAHLRPYAFLAIAWILNTHETTQEAP